MLKQSGKIILVLMCITFVASSSYATTLLMLVGESTTILVEDQDFVPLGFNSDPDANPNLGAVGFSGTIDGFVVTVSLGTTKPLLGSTTRPEIDLFNVSISGGEGTLNIYFTDTDFSSAFFPTALTGWKTLVGGTTSGSVTIESWLGTGNTTFEMTKSLTGGPKVFGSGAFSGTFFDSFDPTSPFSLTLAATVVHGSGTKISSFDANLTAIPEPGTVILLGFGLVGIGLYGRRRRKS